MSILNATELYTYEWLKCKFYVVYIFPELRKNE